LFLDVRLPRPLHRSEKATLDRIEPRIAELPIRMGAELRRRFVERFRAANLELCSEQQIPEQGLDFSGREDPEPTPGLVLERVFSFETHQALQRIAGSGRKQDPEGGMDRLVDYWTGSSSRSGPA
jgi:hypothetical protein